MALGKRLGLLVDIELLSPQCFELRHRRDAIARPAAGLLRLGLLAFLFGLLGLLLGLFLLLVELRDLLLERVEDMVETLAGLLLIFSRLGRLLRFILQFFLL